MNYERPTIRTMAADQIVESIGPVQGYAGVQPLSETPVYRARTGANWNRS